MRLQKVKFKCGLRKYCFTTIYILFIESEEMARRLIRPALRLHRRRFRRFSRFN